MASSISKVELTKPVFLMAGIPLAFSLAAFIIAKITTRKSSCLEASPPDIQVNSMEFNSPESDSHEVCGDDGSFHSHDHMTTLLSTGDENASINTQLRSLSEEEILCLRSKIKELQAREWEIEARFLRYHDMKEQEFALMESQNNLSLELARVECMDREVSSMEAEHQRFEEMAIDYLKALEELESSRVENTMLQRRVKKLLKRLKGRSSVISKQNLRIEATEAVISRNDMELESKTDTIKELEDEIEELLTAIRRLLEEKIELLKKLEVAENSVSLKSDAGRKTIEDHDQVVNELEQLQKYGADEVKELIYLRWCNACLRRELLRRNQEQEEKLEGKKIKPELDFGTSGVMGGFGPENASESSILLHGDPSFGFNSGRHGHSKRRTRLHEKFKKWVQGREKATKHKLEVKKKPEFKWFGSHSVAHSVAEMQFPVNEVVYQCISR